VIYETLECTTRNSCRQQTHFVTLQRSHKEEGKERQCQYHYVNLQDAAKIEER
jgi:hypothetical protein